MSRPSSSRSTSSYSETGTYSSTRTPSSLSTGSFTDSVASSRRRRRALELRKTRPSYLSGTRHKDAPTRDMFGHRMGDKYTRAGGFGGSVTTIPRAWREGARHTVYDTHGGQYTGQWLNDLKHGRGVQVWQSGDRYEGDWEEDMRQGQGTFWDCVEGELQLQYSGGWLRDQRHVSAA